MQPPAETTLNPSLPPTHPPRWRVALCFGLILGLAAMLRWHGITSRGFFFDELWHVEVSNGYGSAFLDLPFDRVVETVNPLLPANARPAWQVPMLTTGVTHPPGAFVSLRLWRDAFGDSMLSLRSWSAAWSLLAVALTFVAAAQSFGRVVGLWAMLFCAASLGNVEEAQDVRGYAMLQAVTLLAAIVLLSMRGRRSAWPSAIALGACVLLMMFTHYFAAGACAGVVVGVITLLRGRARWQAAGAVVGAAILWTVLWLPSLRAQLAFVSATADVFLVDDSASPILATLMRAAIAPYRSLVADPDPWGGVAIVSSLVVCGLLACRIVPLRTRDAVTWLWAGLVVGTLGLLFAIDMVRHTKHLEFPRYLVLASPPLCVLLGSLPASRWRLRPIVAIAMAVAYYFTPTAAKPDLRPQLAFLEHRASPGDVILLPARPDRPHDGQSRYLSIAYGLRWPSHRIAIPVGPQPLAWLDALPRDVRWFCLSFADYEPSTWQPGLTVVERGPASSGVAVYEVRRSP